MKNTSAGFDSMIKTPCPDKERPCQERVIAAKQITDGNGRPSAFVDLIKHVSRTKTRTQTLSDICNLVSQSDGK